MSDCEDEEQLVDYSQLLNKKKKGQNLKKGIKLNATSDIEHNQLEKARQSLFECISHKERAKNTSIGKLEGNYVLISQNKGSHLHTMGFSSKGVITLYLEEAAFLVARNALIVYGENDALLTFEDLFEMICEENDHWISYDKYQVYAYLKRLGFIVTRSKNTLHNSHAMQIKVNYGNSVYKANRPLAWDYMHRDFTSIYSTLQIIPCSPWYKPFYKSLCPSFDWDVYKPRATWKKKDPGVEDFKVVVRNIQDPMPSLYHQNQLFYQSLGKPNTSYGHTIKDTHLVDYSPTFLMALVGDAEGVTFLKMIGDGLADISNKYFKKNK